MDVGTTLSDKDVTCQDELTVGAFYAKSFGFGIATISGRTYLSYVPFWITPLFML